jgi:dTDP-4-amino-4,6-dideoxygalactose transaminase
MTDIHVDFNKPSLMGNEMAYLQEAIENRHISGDGSFTRRCQDYLQQVLGVPRALLTTSCTHALEMSAFLLDLQPGDEVIVPSFTFVSTANAFVIRGARPVFIDIRPDTLNLDERLLERHLSVRTRAIYPVHYAGVGCEMDTIMAFASQHGLAVVEDNAHGLFGRYRGRSLGTFGVMGTQSFHETKNFTCGEGGALLINDAQYAERAEIIREKGTNRSRFFRGMVDKYTWVDVGSSYVLSDLLAAFLYAQFEVAEQIQARRRRIWDFYDQNLRDWAQGHGVATPFVPLHCEQPYHMYYLLLPSFGVRQAFIASLREKGIYSVFHYLPLHLSEVGHSFGGRPGDCPVTESTSDRLVRLPFYTNLTESEQCRVVEAVQAFRF